jgi:hypothetical protein
MKESLIKSTLFLFVAFSFVISLPAARGEEKPQSII